MSALFAWLRERARVLDRVNGSRATRGAFGGLDPVCAPGPRGFAFAKFASAEGVTAMLRIYDVSLDVVEELQPVIRRIERFDRDLARQLKKASTSVPLNIAEGSFAHGGHRRERYQSACSSMRESKACCDSAIRAGYIDGISESLQGKMRQVIGTLVINLRR